MTSSAETLPETGTVRILDHAIEMLTAAHPVPGHLIDLPCGTGYLSTRAASAGWRVTPADISPELWQGDPATKALRADLDATLPFPESDTDAIVCCEGIEHIENPWNALREFRRILRPGGDLIISIPNTIDVRQRFRMLKRGHWGHYFPNVQGHINHMGTFVLCHALLQSGFTIHSISSPKQYGGFYRLLAPFMSFKPSCGLPGEVCDMLSSATVLCARTVIVHATAQGQPGPRRGAYVAASHANDQVEDEVGKIVE